MGAIKKPPRPGGLDLSAHFGIEAAFVAGDDAAAEFHGLSLCGIGGALQQNGGAFRVDLQPFAFLFAGQHRLKNLFDAGDEDLIIIGKGFIKRSIFGYLIFQPRHQRLRDAGGFHHHRRIVCIADAGQHDQRIGLFYAEDLAMLFAGGLYGERKHLGRGGIYIKT